MSNSKICIVLSLLLLWTSCKKDEDKISNCKLLSSDDYLIFGTYYGFCIGDCASIYKLTTSELHEDSIANFEKEKPISFKTQALPTSKLSTAAVLCDSFPLDRLFSEQETVGCPDCHDQGVVYLELKKSGQVKKWYVDPDVNADKVPAYLKTYIKELKAALDKLK